MNSTRFSYLPFCACLSAALLLVACNKEKKAAPSAGPSTTSSQASGPAELAPDEVVATINGQKITAAQLDEQIKPQLRNLDEQIQKTRFQIRRQGLDQMIIERLVKAEAAKTGMTDEQYMQAEVEKKVTPPSDQKIKETFAQYSSQLPPGAKLEDYKTRIADALTRTERAEKANALFERLRKENKVVVKLSEPRRSVEAKGPARGPESAPVTVVEFSDFQCPYCSRARETIDQMMQSYPGKVRLVFRQFPLDNIHKNARKAAEAGLCANDQGKFWEYHDVLFKNQQKLEVPQLKEHAGEVGLNSAQFASCLDQGKHAKDVSDDLAAGEKVGVGGTPTVFVNGIMVSSVTLDELKRVIDQELGAH
jgi:protein-disulfide isomerase